VCSMGRNSDAVSKYPLFSQKRKLEEKTETAVRLCENSFMSAGSSSSRAAGMLAAITRHRAGRIRRARRS